MNSSTTTATPPVMKLGGTPLKPPKLTGSLPGDDQGLLMMEFLADFESRGRLCAISPAGNADLGAIHGNQRPAGALSQVRRDPGFQQLDQFGAMKAYLSGISRHMTRA